VCVYIHIYTLFKLERNTRNNNYNYNNTSLPSFCAFFFRVIYNIHIVTHTKNKNTEKITVRYFYAGEKRKKNGNIVEYR